ncbi:MAG: VRR-NUC domain-containing protein [Amphritea sp.]|nr:VRR-NUC domain-containing protein [Amphritea sp.]
MADISFQPASLSDPLYYLANARLLIQWSLEHHHDLLLPDEVALLNRLLETSDDTQALLIRMVMRKGELFRLDSLEYREITDSLSAIVSLEQQGLVHTDPALNIEQLCRLLRKAECLILARSLLPDQQIPASTSKALLTEELLMQFADAPPRSLSQWWPSATTSLLQLTVMPLFERLRLMFFGNLHQDGSEFVLTELGIQHYETVTLNRESRAFSSRQDVDLYLQMQAVYDALEQGESSSTLAADLPTQVDNNWLNRRYHKVLFELGHSAERQGDISTALALYQRSNTPQAAIRALRVKEKQPDNDHCALYREAQALSEKYQQPEYRISFERVSQRCARKAGISHSRPAKIKLPEQRLTLPRQQDKSVEQQVIDHLTRQGYRAFHTESQLINGLFGLLFWPAIFSPVKGTFFHPFQSGPADLYDPAFTTPRQNLIDSLLKSLDSDQYKQQIHSTYHQKLGTSCAMIHWPSLPSELLDLALDLIPSDHLKTVFEHLLLDLKHHRRGLPDLTCFDPANQSYQLIEVKGPGDRLQDHQRLWIEFLIAQGIETEVWYVEWEDGL